MRWKAKPRAQLRSTLTAGRHVSIETGARRAQPGIAPISHRELLALRRTLEELLDRLPGRTRGGAGGASN